MTTINSRSRLEYFISKLFLVHISNFSLFKIDWDQADNLNEENKNNDHVKNYLKSFGDEFQIRVKDLILSNFKTNPMVRIDAEIIHHAIYCKKLNSKLNVDNNFIEKVFILLTQDIKFN
jgi:hypothetical protein